MQSFILPEQEDEETKRKMAIMQAMQGGIPQNAGQGVSAVAQALMQREAGRGAAFPAAPGGQQPGMGTRFMNMITGGRNGGLG
jgi:hypothetical protein